MQPALRHGITSFKPLTTCTQYAALRSVARGSRTQQWLPTECDPKITTGALSRGYASRRWLHVSTKRCQYDNVTKNVSSVTGQDPTASSDQKAKALPSDTASKRWEISERMTKMLDGVLARASIASQHINAYTGTDYSGIDSLRKEITQQESKVRDFHEAVEEAKQGYEEELAKQGSSQKEIVSLLERKSQWSPSDLERYMALVRTEHVHEQALQSAKNHLDLAERDLENTRGFLEKLERKQYHEEQIWSDTIRRNSTWVTFGLMGVNIILLLAQILIFEPYRRKKIVLEMKAALDERGVNAPPLQIERQIDTLIPPPGTLEQLEDTASDATAERPNEGIVMIEPVPSISDPIKERSDEPRVWETFQGRFNNLFSDRLVQMKQIDVTTIALQGTATGAAIVGLFFILLKPK